MSTPKRPRSPFAGKSPVTPAAPAPENAPAHQPPVSDAAVAGTSTATGGPTTKRRAVKVAYYEDPEDTNQARGAWAATQDAEQDRSFSDFIHKAVAAEVLRRQQLYNGGQPFTPREAGSISPGRRAGVNY